MVSKMIIVFVAVTCWTAQSKAAAVTDVSDAESAWAEHKGKHGLSYSHAEEMQRKTNFARTHATIQKHNSDPTATYRMAHNKFSDWSDAERKARNGYKSFPIPTGTTTPQLRATTALPASVDYRTHTCMQAIKDQGNCGSCYAFSAIASVEFSNCIKHGKAVALSEQQIVDCSITPTGNDGCNGGWQPDAWAYIAGNGGVDTSASYTYKSGTTGTNGACAYNVSTVAAKVTATSSPATYSNSAIFINANDVTTMKTVLANNGTVATGIYVSNNFNNYASGVFSDTACGANGADHAVTIVGYGISGTNNYWIVRNSWSTAWGIAGYALFQRGTNMCQIEVNAMYVNVA